MRCSIFLSLRFLLFCFCFLGLQYISMAESYTVTLQPDSSPYDGHISMRVVTLPYGDGVYNVSLSLSPDGGFACSTDYNCSFDPFSGDRGTRFYDSSMGGSHSVDIDFTGKTTFLFWWGWSGCGTNPVTVTFTPQFTVNSKPVLPNPITRSIQQTLFWSWDLTNPQIAESTLPVTYSISGAPSWVQISDGIICGTCPSGQQNFSFTLTATNSVGSASATVNVTVSGAGPVFSDVCKITQTQGTNMNVDLHSFIVSGTTPITITQKTLPPPGLSLSTAGVLSGICTSAGTYTYEVSASNVVGVGNKVFTIEITGAGPIFIGSPPIVWTVFKDCSLTFDLKQYFSGDSLTFSATGLPSWLSLDSSTGLVTGVCPLSETRQNITGISVSVSNPYGDASYSGFIIDIKSIGGDQFYFTSASSSSGTVGQAFNYQSATNVSSGVTYSMSGAPSWLSCTSAGYVSGAVPEGVTGFSYQITASHPELGSISMTVQCTALTSTGSGSASHVIVDNFNDFGSTGWAKGVTSGMGTIAQEISGVKTGINSLISSNKLFSTGLDSLIAQSSLLNSNASSINNNLTGFRGEYNSRSSELLSAINAASGKLDGLNGISELGNKLDKLNSDINTNSALQNNKLDKLNNDMNTKLDKLNNDMNNNAFQNNQNLNNINTGVGLLNDGIEGVNANLNTLNGGIDNVNNNLTDLNTNLLNITDIVGLKLDDIHNEQLTQTGLLTDIRDALNFEGGTVPDMEVDYTKTVHNSVSQVTFFNSYLNKNYQQVAPVLTIPLHRIHESFPDRTIDFNDSNLLSVIQYMRLIEIGCFAIACLFMIFNIIRTFEY